MLKMDSHLYEAGSLREASQTRETVIEVAVRIELAMYEANTGSYRVTLNMAGTFSEQPLLENTKQRISCQSHTESPSMFLLLKEAI